MDGYTQALVLKAQACRAEAARRPDLALKSLELARAYEAAAGRAAQMTLPLESGE